MGPLGGAEGVDGASGEACERAGPETRIRREESLTGLDGYQIVLADDLARDGVSGIVIPQVFEHEFTLVDVPRFRRENRMQRRLPRDCRAHPVSLTPPQRSLEHSLEQNNDIVEQKPQKTISL